MGKKKNGIPDRWSDYNPVGVVISGTKIVAFKVPLNTSLCQRLLPEDEWFTPAMLLEKEPKIKTVIDLTNTFRYYDGQEEFGTKGIDHVKILVEGRGTIPTVSQLQKFFDAVDYHMDKYKDNNDALIGVHCTHGLNRTGYFICRWMLERMNINPDDAISRFNKARGHHIEREHLLIDLRRKNRPLVPRSLRSSSPRPPPRRNEYRSPLDDSSYDEPSRDSRYGRRSGRHRHDSDNRRGGRGVSERYHSERDRDNRDSRRERPGDGQYGDRGVSDHSHSEREVSDPYRTGHQQNPYQRNVNYEKYGTTKWRRPGGSGPSRADLDTNWRTRGPEEGTSRGEQRHYQNFGGSGDHKRRSMNDSYRNRSPVKRN